MKQILGEKHSADAKLALMVPATLNKTNELSGRLAQAPKNRANGSSSVERPDVSRPWVVYSTGARNGNNGTCAALED
jgi:hypothetical protein